MERAPRTPDTEAVTLECTNDLRKRQVLHVIAPRQMIATLDSDHARAEFYQGFHYHAAGFKQVPQWRVIIYGYSGQMTGVLLVDRIKNTRPFRS